MKTPHLALLATLLVPAIAYAEVMDKEPTVRDIWTANVVLGVVGLALWSARRWLLASLALVGAVVWHFAFVNEVSEPAMHASILAEVGPGYFTQELTAFACCLLAQGAGL